MTLFKRWQHLSRDTIKPGGLILSFLAITTVLVAGMIGSRSSGMLVDVVDGRELPVIIVLVAGLIGAAFIFVVYDRMAFLCFAMLGLVRIEPAPVDALSMLLLALGIISGRLSLISLRNSSVFHTAIWLFLLVNFISLPGATDYAYAIQYTAVTIYLIGFAYFVKMYATSFRSMQYVMFGYLVSSLLSVFLVVLGFAGVGPPELFVFQSRATAFFKDTNVYAPSLVLAVVFLVDEIFKPRFIPGWTWLKLICVFFLAGGVFLSFSRASTANLLLSLGIYFLFNLQEVLQPKRILALLVLCILAIIGMAAVIVQLDLVDFLLWRASPVQSYDISNRFATQALGIQAGLTHLFGIGPGMLADAHSLYIRTFAEYGVFGLVALVTGLIILVVHLWRAAIQEVDKPYGLSAQVVFASFISMLLNGFVIDLIHWRQFWFLVGLAWVVSVAHHCTLSTMNHSDQNRRSTRDVASSF